MITSELVVGGGASYAKPLLYELRLRSIATAWSLPAGESLPLPAAVLSTAEAGRSEPL